MRRPTFALCLLAAYLQPLAVPHRAEAQDDSPLVVVGKFKVEESGVFRRLLHDGVLWGSQVRDLYMHRMDSPIPFGSYSPWDVLLLEGTFAAWDPRKEPLTYYHRSGPVGAVFQLLHTRGGGKDATAPVGVVGLNTGAIAAYSRAKQSFTFYETDPALKGLVADTDKYFTHIADARKRGATIAVRTGDVRKNLEKDADRKFAVLFVEMFDDGFDPGPRLTLEAVKLYADRITPDGMVALHISNKFFRLEPVVAQIAKELNIECRVWNDDGERRPGKTASSWVVLTRDKTTLDRLDKPSPAALEFWQFKSLRPLAGLKARRDGDTVWPPELRHSDGIPIKD